MLFCFVCVKCVGNGITNQTVIAEILM